MSSIKFVETLLRILNYVHNTINIDKKRSEYIPKSCVLFVTMGANRSFEWTRYL